MDDEEDPKALLHEMLDDKKRVGYYKGYLAAVAEAIKYTWVDYKNGLSRHPKSSALWFSRFLKGDEGKTIKED
ncbi:hypothetical protein MKX03_033919 [Papaver bracteatum]|nr:hypothetical protein MKX03_033919 [Papaver bracteatum]